MIISALAYLYFCRYAVSLRRGSAALFKSELPACLPGLYQQLGAKVIECLTFKSHESLMSWILVKHCCSCCSLLFGYYHVNEQGFSVEDVPCHGNMDMHSRALRQNRQSETAIARCWIFQGIFKYVCASSITSALNVIIGRYALRARVSALFSVLQAMLSLCYFGVRVHVCVCLLGVCLFVSVLAALHAGICSRD